MGKYEPLERYLRDHRLHRWRPSFPEIEKLLGFKLPASAYRHPAWWSNDSTGHSHALAWLDAGWRTEEVDLASGKLTFTRVETGSNDGLASAGRDPWGCMAGTVTIMPGTDLTAPSEEWNAQVGRLLNE